MFFSSNNQKNVIFDQNNLVEYQFDVVDFIAHVFRDIRDDLGAVGCRMQKNEQLCEKCKICWWCKVMSFDSNFKRKCSFFINFQFSWLLHVVNRLQSLWKCSQWILRHHIDHQLCWIYPIRHISTYIFADRQNIVKVPLFWPFSIQ